MRYNAERDIPKAVNELKSLSPTKIAEWVKSHRTTTDGKGRRIQFNITPQAVTMFFKRNPAIHNRLAEALKDEEISGVVIRETLFTNGAFLELPCIKDWERKYYAGGGKEKSFNQYVGNLKMICQGILPTPRGQKEVKLIPEWGMKHPRQLTFNDGLAYITETQKLGLANRRFRITLRSFFKARRIDGWDEISGKQPEEGGKYAHLFVASEKLDEMLRFIKARNVVAFKACLFSRKTGARMGGVQSAHSSKVNKVEHTITILEKASRGKAKRKMEKFIDQELWDILDLDNAKGKIFNIDEAELRQLCTEAINAIIPEKAEEIPMPFHFWRHMFAQHMLRLTDWNYGIVGALGGWSVEALERYYGKMPRDVKLRKAKQFIPNL